jgi:CBS domain-containing protein
MRVEQVMTKTVATCSPGGTLNDAARAMWERDCGFVPVTESDGSGRVVGIVTDRDACMAAYTRGQALAQIRIGDVMSTGVRSCKPSDEIAEAETVMRRAQIHRLPVIDDAGRLVGVISLADIACEAARESGTSRRDVTPTEIGETLAEIRKPRAIATATA